MPIERVTSEQFEALAIRCKAFIDEGRNPIGGLSAEEHETLTQLHIDNPTGAAVFLEQLRDHAQHNPNRDLRWSAHATRGLNFNVYVDAARAFREQTNRAADNVIELATRRASGRQSSGMLAQLEPAVMIGMQSPRMRGIGLLRLKAEGRLWYDDFRKRFMTDWSGTADMRTLSPRPINDSFVLSVALWLVQWDDKLGAVTDRQTHSWINTAAEMDKRNEPRDWLNGLVWDGVPRIDAVLWRGFGAQQSDFNEAASRCWFVGMVARIMRPGCQLDTMPVLIGPQGIGKSQALRVIGGDWYRSAVSDIHSKDFKQELFAAIVFEIPELHSLVTSNAAAAKVKAVISNQVDHFRLPYGYTVEEFKRTAVMVGTTNSRDWHHDESGARRFWPIHCSAVDLEWLRSSRDQLFAEARACFDLGVDDERGQWWNVPIEAQRALMDDETSEDIWHSMIEARLQAGRDSVWRGSGPIEAPDNVVGEHAQWGNLLTTQRIAIDWLRLGTDLAARRITANRIGAIMRAIGWRRALQRIPATNVRYRVWLPDSGASDADSVAAVTDDTDLAF